MKKNFSGLTASGQTQPEIRPGDIWKDHHGSRIVILAASLLRVEYRRVGYDKICICSPSRFYWDFEFVEGSTNTTDVSRFIQAGNGKEKIRVLREIIQERLKK
ncbi:DUF4222 domain-containing protein [Klebsiella aerogenes]|uniref:DUF4222 domain-containing protein n=1 Tax=Klebsiella aerogenes TaxID=548 RepID=UPI001F1FB90D|nr:DUF4222 domain-containing protein [Klebsiella aerogenes]